MRTFHKMHGLGNDFVIFDARDQPLTLNDQQIRHLANRRRGIGCDQLIILRHSDRAEIAMQIFNSDGGEVSACGNATRCVVALIGRETLSIETGAGILHGSLADDRISVAMGRPEFEWQNIPLDYAMVTQNMPVSWGCLSDPMCINVGNPHIVFFVDDQGLIDLEKLGPVIENDPLFPERVNVNVAKITAQGVDLRVWERGAGLTEACGTGACATAVVAIRKNLCASPVAVNLPGGTLSIAWQPGEEVIMTGPFAHSFTGETEL